MSFSKIISKTIYGLTYPVIKRNYNQFNHFYYINLRKKIFNRKSGHLSKNELHRLYEQNIDENKMLTLSYSNLLNQNDNKIKLNEIINSTSLENRFYFSPVLLNIMVNNEYYVYLTNDNIDLKKINYDNIPIITYYSILKIALWVDRNNVDNPLNFNKKICSIVDAIHLGPDAEEDLKILSRVFYNLFNDFVQDTIVKMDKKEDSIRAFRNALAHDNYFSFSKIDTMNWSCFEELKACPFLDPERKLDKLKKDDVVIWNMDRQNGRIDIRFCYIINEKDLRIFVKKFKGICNKIVEKSKENQSKNSEAKYINDLIEAKLIEYIRQADKLSTFTS